MVLSFKKTAVYGGFALAIFVVLTSATNVIAQLRPGGDFGLQVTPSPLIATLKPGTATELELKIRNTGTGAERLRIQPREFDVDKKTGEVKLLDTAPAQIKDWINFSAPTFNVDPGKVFTQKITIDLPKETGFSYSFSLLISRAGSEEKVNSGAALKGSVAVFTLLNIDRPGATRKFEVSDFKATQPVYEYLPASFDISFQNTGNTIVQPKGNVFIQRGDNDREPISVLQVNPARGYLLPDRPRTLTTKWSEGFPAYKAVTGVDGQPKEELAWDWSKIADFRIGLYTAKLVAVYNDGQRDIPIERAITFWVIPWRLILGFLVVLVVFVVGAWVILRKGSKVLRPRKKHRSE